MRVEITDSNHEFHDWSGDLVVIGACMDGLDS
jgi:hypothetical protein